MQFNLSRDIISRAFIMKNTSVANESDFIEYYKPDKRNFYFLTITQALSLAFYIWYFVHRVGPAGNPSAFRAGVILIMATSCAVCLGLILIFPSNKGTIAISKKGVLNSTVFGRKHFTTWEEIDDFKLGRVNTNKLYN